MAMISQYIYMHYIYTTYIDMYTYIYILWTAQASTPETKLLQSSGNKPVSDFFPQVSHTVRSKAGEAKQKTTMLGLPQSQMTVLSQAFGRHQQVSHPPTIRASLSHWCCRWLCCLPFGEWRSTSWKRCVQGCGFTLPKISMKNWESIHHCTHMKVRS